MTTEPRVQEEGVRPERIQTEIGQIARGAGLGLGGNIYYYFINFLFGILVARQVGAEAFGLYTLGVTAVTLLARFSVVGLDRGSLRYVSIKRREGEGAAMWQVIWTSIGIGLAVSLAAAAALAFYPEFFLKLFHWDDKKALLKLFPIFALALPAMTMTSIGIAGTQAFRTLRYRALIPNFILPTVKLLVTLALLFALGVSALPPTVGFVSAQILGGVLSVYFLWRLASKITRKVQWEPGLLSELMRYSLPLLLSSVLVYLNGRTEIMVLGIFNQANASGIYNAALRLAGLTMLVLTAFNAIFAPVIADLHHRSQMEELGALFKLVTRWVIIVAMPIFLVQILFPHQLIGLFGKDFASGALALRILSIGTLINFSTGAVGIMLLMSGHSSLAMFNSFLTLTIALSLDFLLIRPYGILGAAIAGMISIALVNLINLGEVRYLLGIHPYNRYTLRPFAAAAPALLGGWLWSRWLPVGNILELMVAAAVMSLIYVAALLVMGWNEDDRMMMAALSKRFRRLMPGRKGG
jgi:O-antigen/teichoic acid export membrane protein